MKHYDVVFRGVLLQSFDEIEVKARVAASFHVPLERLDTMFSGVAVPLKRGLEQNEAEQVKKHLLGMGLKTTVEPSHQVR